MKMLNPIFEITYIDHDQVVTQQAGHNVLYETVHKNLLLSARIIKANVSQSRFDTHYSSLHRHELRTTNQLSDIRYICTMINQDNKISRLVDATPQNVLDAIATGTILNLESVSPY